MRFLPSSFCSSPLLPLLSITTLSLRPPCRPRVLAMSSWTVFSLLVYTVADIALAASSRRKVRPMEEGFLSILSVHRDDERARVLFSYISVSSVYPSPSSLRHYRPTGLYKYVPARLYNEKPRLNTTPKSKSIRKINLTAEPHTSLIARAVPACLVVLFSFSPQPDASSCVYLVYPH